MNHRLIANQLGWLLLLLAFALAGMALFAMVEDLRGRPAERAALGAFLASSAIAGLVAWSLLVAAPRPRAEMGRREAVLLVLLSWLVGPAVCALPFWIWGLGMGEAIPEPPFRGFVPAFFESMSGLSTCGASVLGRVEEYPRSILLWRSSTHWIGGVGIVVLFVAVLPSLGMAGKRLALAEGSMVTPEGLRPQVREAARVLWMIYAGLTLAEVVLLVLAGMGLFDAVCHAFSTVATGGFSTRSASIAAFDSVAIELIVVVFMFLGGVNFALYDRLVRHHRRVFRDSELRWYAGIVVAAFVMASLSLWFDGSPLVRTDGTQVEATLPQCLRSGLFVITSMQTTTGFCTVDYGHWPVLAVVMIAGVMLVGGCAGSTAGGIKVIRTVIGVRCVGFEIEREYRPTVVRPLLVGTSSVDTETRIGAAILVLAAIVIVLLGGSTLLAVEPDSRMDLATAFSASLACFSVVGPAFGGVDAVNNYGWMSDPSLAALSAIMLLGRLEIFAVLAVLSRRFWQGG